MQAIETMIQAQGFSLARLGGNCTGWAKRLGSVSIRIAHTDMDAFADRTEAEWIIGAHDDGGSYLLYDDAMPLAKALELAATLPNEAFSSFAEDHPGFSFHGA